MKVSGIASWAFLTKAKPAFKTKGSTIPSTYTVDLILDIKTAKALKAEGLNVKRVTKEISGIEDAIGKPYLTIKKPAEFDGIPTSPPEVVDSKLNPFNGIIGNGSKISVVFATKAWEGFGTTGVAAKLRKVQVLDLVTYAGKEELEDFSTEDGFVATEKKEDDIPSYTTNADDFSDDSIDF